MNDYQKNLILFSENSDHQLPESEIITEAVLSISQLLAGNTIDYTKIGKEISEAIRDALIEFSEEYAIEIDGEMTQSELEAEWNRDADKAGIH